MTWQIPQHYNWHCSALQGNMLIIQTQNYATTDPKDRLKNKIQKFIDDSQLFALNHNFLSCIHLKLEWHQTVWFSPPGCSTNCNLQNFVLPRVVIIPKLFQLYQLQSKHFHLFSSCLTFPLKRTTGKMTLRVEAV